MLCFSPPSLTVHELKEFVDHRLEELPVGSEEAWILANDVHDVGGYDGLVVLSSLLLTQTQQVLRKRGEKRQWAERMMTVLSSQTVFQFIDDRIVTMSMLLIDRNINSSNSSEERSGFN